MGSNAGKMMAPEHLEPWDPVGLANNCHISQLLMPRRSNGQHHKDVLKKAHYKRAFADPATGTSRDIFLLYCSFPLRQGRKINEDIPKTV